LRAATSKDRADVVKYCFDHSTPVTLEVMKIIFMNRTKEVYKLLLDTNVIEVKSYIPWFGDMLSDAPTHDDFKMATICLSPSGDPNTNLIDEHLRFLAAVADLASVGITRLLLKHGARLRGRCAIIKVAEAGKLVMVRVLMEEAADVNKVGIEHPNDLRYKVNIGTALHRAVIGRHEIVRPLLKDPMGRTPLALALDKGNDFIYSILRNQLNRVFEKLA
ncbi:hypothetical protein BDR22DRAFT_801055, partial [Usnea florida]